MLDPRNTVNLTCGIVADPEMVTDNILKMRVAVDYAGSEKGGSTSGYFDVTYYTNNDDNQRNAKFVKSQVSEGKMKKGSQIQVLGRLVQERWTTDDRKGQKVVIVAESISYAGGGRANSGDSEGGTTQAATAVPNNF